MNECMEYYTSGLISGKEMGWVIYWAIYFKILKILRVRRFIFAGLN